MPEIQYLTLAFYRHQGRFFDRLIRLITRSPYSHVELVLSSGVQMSSDQDWRLYSLSSSLRDGGVRIKIIHYEVGKWEFVQLENWSKTHDGVWLTARQYVGQPYDILGIMFNFMVPIRRQLRRSWFCSELCGHALGIKHPHTLSPGDLFDQVQQLNKAYLCGRLDGHINDV
ncbi:MAG: hypothetical protein COB84_07835 [Rhodobacteraceae bacterium]|nr:MAG: hypothetical protein COB84_07835 [Paracoccaceae bacterium]